MLLIGRNRIRANHQYVGGSCGNVLTILAYLGWDSYPVARLGVDRRALRVLQDLKACHVKTRFVTRERHGVTPAIVVRMAEATQGAGYTTRFEWRDPASGDWLPRYRPLPKKIAEALSPQLPPAKVFYFDRAEPATLHLASQLREKGAVVFFEPSSCRNEPIFTACLGVSDVVKYSAERIPSPPRNPVSYSPRMEIQTLADKGLRYRLKTASHRPGPWKSLPAFTPTKFLDATGCGDWCSAGIIATLCQSGRDHFLASSEDTIQEGLLFGQALASLNCQYEGARGLMYTLPRKALFEQIRKILAQGAASS